MSERRRGLGKGLGALIPSGPQSLTHTERPVDLLFRDRQSGKSEGFTGNIAPGRALDALVPPATDRRHEAPASEEQAADVDQAPRPSDDATQPDSAQPEHGESESVGADVVAGEDATPGEEPGHRDDVEQAAAEAGDAEAAQVDAQGDAPVVDHAEHLVEVPGAVFAELPVREIRPNPRQPRSVFDEDALAELTHSIREIGLLQPVVVRRVEGADHYELVMGERRWRAAQAAGLESMPAIIRETTDDDLLRDALLENLHRADLNPLEEAAAYEQLLSDFGCTHEELATRIGRSRPQISNMIRLLKLPALVQRRVAAGVLSAGHARALLSLADAAAMERLAQRIVAEGLSVRATEEIVALGGDPERPVRAPRSKAPHKYQEQLDAAANRLADLLETRVSVAMGRKSGKLTVEFADLDDLERILAGIGRGED